MTASLRLGKLLDSGAAAAAAAASRSSASTASAQALERPHGLDILEGARSERGGGRGVRM